MERGQHRELPGVSSPKVLSRPCVVKKRLGFGAQNDIEKVRTLVPVEGFPGPVAATLSNVVEDVWMFLLDVEVVAPLRRWQQRMTNLPRSLSALQTNTDRGTSTLNRSTRGACSASILANHVGYISGGHAPLFNVQRHSVI